jgi:hypothetical protein
MRGKPGSPAQIARRWFDGGGVNAITGRLVTRAVQVPKMAKVAGPPVGSVAARPTRCAREAASSGSAVYWQLSPGGPQCSLQRMPAGQQAARQRRSAAG